MSKVITKNTLLTITSKKAIAGQKVITVRKNTFTDLFSILGGGGRGNRILLLTCTFKSIESVKIDKIFKIYFIALNEFKKNIQLQFATNRIKISPLEQEIQPPKDARRHYAGPMTSRDVIGMPPVCNSITCNTL